MDLETLRRSSEGLLQFKVCNYWINLALCLSSYISPMMSFVWQSVCVDVQIHYQALIKMKGVRGRMEELSFSGAGPVSDKCSSIYTIRVISLPLLSLFPSSCFFLSRSPLSRPPDLCSPPLFSLSLCWPLNSLQ